MILVVIVPLTVCVSVTAPSLIVMIEPVIEVPPSDAGGAQVSAI